MILARNAAWTNATVADQLLQLDIFADDNMSL